MAKPEKSGASAQEIQEELTFLRQKCNSLSFRGNYAECLKLIEGNLSLLYFQDRRPEDFLAMLRIHQRCYPSLNHAQSYEEYLETLLRKHKIPHILCRVLRNISESTPLTVEFFREWAITCKNGKDFEEALAYCDVALHMEPYNSNTCLLRGWILEDLGRLDDAGTMYEQALEHNKTNYQASNSLAKIYMERDPKKALRYIQEAIDAYPGEGTFFATKALICARLGDTAAALDAYDHAIALEPENADLPYEKGEMLLKDGKEALASTLYRKALSVNGNHIPSLMRMVQICEEKQQEQALGYANTIIKLDSRNIQAQLAAARLHRKLGNLTQSVRQYRQVLREDEKNVEALVGIGGTLLKDDPARALDYFNKALELVPNSYEYHMGKGEAHQALEDYEDAAKEYKTALTLNKKEAKPYAYLGKIYTILQKPQQALEYLEKACAMAPDNAYYQADRGMLLASVPGKEKEALSVLNLASGLDPGNAQLHMRLADILDVNGKRASAIRHYELAINMANDSSRAHFGLARLLMATEPHKALVHINQAIHLESVNSLYYYTKALLLCEMNRNERAREMLLEIQANEADAGNVQMADELNTLISGEMLRVALFYVDRAIEMDTQANSYICLRARLFGEMGQRGKAMEQYEQLLKQDPNNHEALYGVGQLYAAKKDDKKALEYLDKAIRIAPAVAAYHGGRASVLARDPAQYKAAVESYRAAAALDIHAWELLLEQGRLMDAYGDLPEAQDCYRKVLLIHRDCLPAAERMAQLLAEKKPHAALSYIDHVLGLDDKNPSYHITKATLLYRLKEDAVAAAECARALEVGQGSDETCLELATALREYATKEALGYALVVEERQEPVSERCLVTLGYIYQKLENTKLSWEYFAKAAAVAPQNHEAKEQMANLFYEEKHEACLSAVEDALEQKSDCPHCNYLKACILDEIVGENLEEALACVQTAVDAMPGYPPYRQKLVELLKKKRVFFQYHREKWRLDRLLRRINAAEAAAEKAEEIDFQPEAEAETPIAQGQRTPQPEG